MCRSPSMPGDSTQAGSRRQFTLGRLWNERLARARSARRRGVLRAQTIQLSPFHAIELVSIRHDCRDLALLGHQKPLELARAYRGIDGEVRPVGGGAVDLLADRVESPD